MNWRKRLLAMLMSLAMVLTYMPTIAFAEGETPDGGSTPAVEETGHAHEHNGDAAQSGTAGQTGSADQTDKTVQAGEQKGSASDEPATVGGSAGAGDAAGAAGTGETDAGDAAGAAGTGESAAPSETTDSTAVTDPAALTDAGDLAEDGATADDPEADLQPDPAILNLTVPGRIERATANVDLADNDELLMEYLQKGMVGKTRSGMLKAAVNTRGSKLKGNNRAVYDLLRPEIAKIAAGERTDATIVLPLRDINPDDYKDAYTAADLGVDSIVADGAISYDAKNAVYGMYSVDFEMVLSALLADMPYEFYWFDKTAGCFNSWSGIGASWNGTEYTISFAEPAVMTFYFSIAVAQEYRGEQVDTFDDGYGGVFPMYSVAKTDTVDTAIDTATQIVEDCLEDTDYNKLVEYKDAICRMVSYNRDAAQNDDTSYGNPWQLIWVFDNDPDTNVVCEGYSKAFQFLCDNTDFDHSGIECHTVSGRMTGGTGAGNHMWNVVTMENGKNYIADITNCDADTIGNPDLLFLTGCMPGGNFDDGYDFDFLDTYLSLGKDGVSDIHYSYDYDMSDIYSEEELDLSTSDYQDPDSRAVESMRFVRHEPLELQENVYVWREKRTDQATGEEYYEYMLPGELMFTQDDENTPEDEADKLYIKYEGDDTEYEYAYYGYGAPGEQVFARYDGNVWDTIDASENGDVEVSSTQEGPWHVGETHNFAIEYKGVIADYPVTIVENPIRSFSFQRYDDEGNAVSVIDLAENVDGFEDEDEAGNEYFSYYIAFKENDRITIEYKDGRTVEYQWVYSDDGEDYFQNPADEDDFFHTELVEQFANEEDWEPGDHVITLRYNGFEYDQNVRIVESGISGISFERTTLGEGDIIEICGDEYEDVYFEFIEGDVLTVTYGDVPVRYELEEIEGDDEFISQFRASSIPAGVDAPEVIAVDDIDVDFYTGDTEVLENGKEYTAEISYLGSKCTFPFRYSKEEITPATHPVSIEFHGQKQLMAIAGQGFIHRSTLYYPGNEFLVTFEDGHGERYICADREITDEYGTYNTVEFFREDPETGELTDERLSISYYVNMDGFQLGTNRICLQTSINNTFLQTDVVEVIGVATEEEITGGGGEHVHELYLVDYVPPTCTEWGCIAYYACRGCDMIFADPNGETVLHYDTDVRTIEPVGHLWLDPRYAWSEDYMTCTATRICGNDDTHVETETADATIVLSDDGLNDLYTYEFENPAFETQTMLVGHTHSLQHFDAVPATVEEAGNIEYWYCALCDRYYTDEEGQNEISREDTVIPPIHVHSLQHIAAFEGDCMKPGNIEFWYCTTCGKCFSDAQGTEEIDESDTVVPAPGHLPGGPVRENEVPATCVTEGSYEEAEYCEVCGQEVSRVYRTIPVTDHTWDDGLIVQAAGCEEDGTIQYACTFCGKTREETIPATGHQWGAPAYAWAEDHSTCTATRICANNISHIETETATSVFDEDTRTYTAEFENGAFATQTYTDPEESNVASITYTPYNRTTLQSVDLGNYDWNTRTWTLYLSKRYNGTFWSDKDELAVNYKDGTSVVYYYRPLRNSFVKKTSNEEKLPDADQLTVVNAADGSDRFYLGQNTITVTYCGATADVSITVEETCMHDDMEHFDRVEPDCDTAGNIEYWHCPKCDKYFQDEYGEYQTSLQGVTLEPQHPWVDVPYQAPTCSQKGVEPHLECTKCGKWFTINTLVPIESDPSSFDIPIDENAHEWDEGTVTKQPTCAEEGVKTYTCIHNSEHTRTESISKTNDHQVHKVEAVEANCSHAGNIEYWECDICGSFFTDETATTYTYYNDVTTYDYENHDYDDGVIVEEPTCGEPGVIKYTCRNNSNHYYTENLPATGDHTLKRVAAKEPTMTMSGNIEYWYCEVCGLVFADAAGTQEISYSDVWIKPYAEYSLVYIDEGREGLWSDGTARYRVDAEVPESGSVSVRAYTERSNGAVRKELTQGTDFSYDAANKIVTLYGDKVLETLGQEGQIQLLAEIKDADGSVVRAAFATCYFQPATYEFMGVDISDTEHYELKDIAGYLAPVAFDKTGNVTICDDKHRVETWLDYEIKSVQIISQTPTSGTGNVITLEETSNDYQFHAKNYGTAVVKIVIEDEEGKQSTFMHNIHVVSDTYYVSVFCDESNLGYDIRTMPGDSLHLTAVGSHYILDKYTQMEEVFEHHSYAWEIVEGQDIVDMQTDENDPAKATVTLKKSAPVDERIIVRAKILDDNGDVKNTSDLTVYVTGRALRVYPESIDSMLEVGHSITITPELRDYYVDINGNVKYKVIPTDDLSLSSWSTNDEYKSIEITQTENKNEFVLTRTNGMGMGYTVTLSFFDEDGNYQRTENRTYSFSDLHHFIKFNECESGKTVTVNNDSQIELTINGDDLSEIDGVTYEFEFGRNYIQGSGPSADAYSVEGNKLTMYGDILERDSQTRVEVTAYAKYNGVTLCETQIYVNVNMVHKHTLVKVPKKDPDCTQPGYKLHYKCSECGMLFMYNEVDSPISESEILIPALGHVEVVTPGKAATCEATGLTDGKKCSRCGETIAVQEVIPALGHSWDEGTVTTAPTVEAEGVKTYTCTRCSKTKTEPIPVITPEEAAAAAQTAQQTAETEEAIAADAVTQAEQAVDSGATDEEIQAIISGAETVADTAVQAAEQAVTAAQDALKAAERAYGADSTQAAAAQQNLDTATLTKASASKIQASAKRVAGKMAAGKAAAALSTAEAAIEAAQGSQDAAVINEAMTAAQDAKTAADAAATKAREARDAAEAALTAAQATGDSQLIREAQQALDDAEDAVTAADDAVTEADEVLAAAQSNLKKELTADNITVASVSYTGSAVEPKVTVMVDGTKLTAGTDYTIDGYSNNVKASSTASVTVTGLGRYAGTVTKVFTIKPAKPTGALTILNTIANSAKKTNDVIWDKSKVKGATNYELQWRTRGSSKWSSTMVGNVVRGVTTGLTIGGLYEIRVRAICKGDTVTGNAYGDWSKSVYRYFFTTQKIRLASKKKGTFTMSWARDPKATGYHVLYTVNANGAGAAQNILPAKASATSLTASTIKVNGKPQKLKSGTTYYVQVREVKTIGGINYIGNISCPVAVKVR